MPGAPGPPGVAGRRNGGVCADTHPVSFPTDTGRRPSGGPATGATALGSSKPTAVGDRSGPAADRARSLRDRGSRVGLRRALSLVVLTVLLPGSAQRLAGSRGVGTLALRTWAVLLVVVSALAVGAVASPRAALGWATTGWVLLVVRVALVAVAVGMAALLVDAWRLGRPVGLRRRHRAVAAAATGALVAAVGGPLLVASSYVQAERHVLSRLFGSAAVSAAVGGHLNVLLVGGDAGPDRTGLRPDSLSVVSIDTATGKPVVIGLPRNLENVPFPVGTRMHALWPHGFDCGNACLLNGIYTWATDHAAQLPGVRDPGLTATREAASAITGLTINYYAMVDLASFRALVDDIGGITVRVGVPVPIGGETSPVKGWIQPGLQHLDGYHALWLARSRSDSSDYARMARQRCVMQAMLTQTTPAKVILAFRSLAATATAYTRTDIPASQLPMLAGLAERAKSVPLRKVDLVPPAVQPGNPDWRVVRAIVAAAVASTGPTAPRTSPAAHAHSAGTGSTAGTHSTAGAGSTGSGRSPAGQRSPAGRSAATGPAAAAAPAVCSVPR